MKKKSATLVIIWVETSPEIVRQRMVDRNSDRDTWKLANWDEYIGSCNFDIPKNLDDSDIKDDLLVFKNNNDEEFESSMKDIIKILEQTI